MSNTDQNKRNEIKNPIHRLEFLANAWEKYPTMPQNINLAGRIEWIDRTQLRILNFGLVEIPQGFMLSRYHLEDVLISGDLVGLRVSENRLQDLILLSPKLSKSFDKGINFDRKHRPNRDMLQKFSQFVLQLRLHFTQKNFLEAMTPTLVPCPGTEVFLEPFVTEFKMGQTRQKVYLPTSPELHLKKMLALGYGPIFEIKNCFRNGEISNHHEPEFLMLEWYRPFSNLNEIKQDLVDLLKDMSGDSHLKVEERTMSELFYDVLKFKLTSQTNKTELLSLAQQLGLRVQAEDSIDDIFNMIFVEKIDPAISEKYSKSQPLVISKYPPFQAAYARLDEHGWADRFELYWKGVELANAFHEINDPNLQRARMQEDLVKKKSKGRSSVDLDVEFLHALEFGTPPSGGIALGIERLFMVLMDAEKIQDFRVFPFQKNSEEL